PPFKKGGRKLLRNLLITLTSSTIRGYRKCLFAIALFLCALSACGTHFCETLIAVFPESFWNFNGAFFRKAPLI
ncbi:MAG: hypothetical protein ACI3XR_03060, partial [Eubacteriales bacterium]